MKTIITTLFIFTLSLCTNAFGILDPVMSSDTISNGTVTISPSEGISNTFGTWTVTHVIGQDGIATNGGIRVQLPDVWHSGPRNSALRLQATEGASDNYIRAYSSNPTVVLHTLVEGQRPGELMKHRKKSLDGRIERNTYVVRVIIKKGTLTKGDTIRVVYGDTSQGSRGYRGPAISAPPRPVLVAVDAKGGSSFSLHSAQPTITSLAGPATELWLTAPSNAIPHSPISLRASLVDREDNPANGPATISLRYPDGVSGPKRVTIPADKTGIDISVTSKTVGIVRIQATWSGESNVITANPIEITKTLPGRQLYWGDLHSHTQHSWDGVGHDAFDYARYTSALDFYAMTDHSLAKIDTMSNGLNADSWESYQAETQRYHPPNKFVTIHAYECSFRQPYGHHNVYFRGDAGELRNPSEVTLPELWNVLEAGNAVTIPHHTGKFPGGVNLNFHSKTFRRNFEMYSGHGLSEVYDPTHPLSFEHSAFTSDAKSLDAPTHIQDAWRLGLHVSAIAASDDHRSRPGLPHYGIAAIRAESLTRNDIFQGLQDRQTYATTGSRIILHFTVNDTEMGQTSSITDKAEIALRIHGTGIIAYAEILRYQPGDKAFQVMKQYTPKAMDFETTWSDPEAAPGSIYYARIQQQRPVHGRMAMAWSSSVWLGTTDEVPLRIDIVNDVPQTLPQVRNIKQISHGPKHHFFGYYGMSPWNSKGGKMIYMESDFGDRLVEAGEEARVILYDVKTEKSTVISTTKAWNFQQGSMLHWLGQSSEIIHNVNIDGKLNSAVVDAFTQKQRILPRAVAAVDLKGKIAASLNYARIRDTRPGYGYAGVVDPWKNEIHPKDDGLYIMDIATGKNSLIVSYDQIFNLEPLPAEVAENKMWFNHVLFSRDSKRIFFMARVKDANNRNVTGAFTVNTDGSELRCILPYSWGASHFDWVNDKELIITTKFQGKTPWLHVLLTDGAPLDTYTTLSRETLGSDGHLHASYDQQWMVTDSYPSGPHRMRKLYLMNMETEEVARIASFHEPKKFHREWRCDLHPRWSLDGERICIDSTNDGTRQVYVVELGVPKGH